MRARILPASIVLSALVLSSAMLAEDRFIPPNVKEGLWETTVSHSMSGMPGIPPDVLAKMTPEQRARTEEMMKQRGATSSGNSAAVKSCLTKEKIAKGMAFNENRENCTRNLTNSSPSRIEVKFHCDDTKSGNKTTVDATTTIDVLSSDTVKGATHAVTSSNGRSMTMDSTFTSKYLGPNCGDVK